VEAGTFSKEQTISVTVNGTTYEREVEARKLLIHFHPRRPRPDRQPHRLRHGQTAVACSVTVDGHAREELHDARGPGRWVEHRDRRRPSPTAMS